MIPLATGDGVPDLKQLLPPVFCPSGQPIFF